MLQNIKNFFNLIFNNTFFKVIITAVPAIGLFYLSYTLPYLVSFALAWQIAIPVACIAISLIAAYEHLKPTVLNIYNNIKNLFKFILGFISDTKETSYKPLNVLNMSFLVSLSVISSLIYGVVLGPAAPLVVFLAPLITLAALNLSKFIKDFLNNWLFNSIQAKLKKFEDILPSEEILNNTAANQKLQIKPGDVIPADCILLSNKATIKDYTIKTGEEYKPYEACQGDELLGGTRNIGSETIEVETIRSGIDSVLYKNIQKLNSNQNSNNNTKLIDRISNYFIPLVLIIATTTLLVWSMLAGFTLGFGFMMDVIFAACPCALGIANMLPISIMKNMAFANNINVYRDEVITKLPHATAIVFDKTGTLTTLTLDNVRHHGDLSELDENDLLQIIIKLQQDRLKTNNNTRASDPFAKAITDKINKDYDLAQASKKLKIANISHVHNGILAKISINGQTKKIYIGNRKFLEEHELNLNHIDSAPISTSDSSIPSDPIDSDNTMAYVVIASEDKAEQKLVSTMTFKQDLRPGAIETINKLRESGIAIYMLTGDKEKPAQEIAERLGIPRSNYKYNLSPSDKKKYVKLLQSKSYRHNVIVAGDGFNDLEQAQEANIGSISIGKTSVMSGFFDIAIDDIRDLTKLIPLAKSTNKNQMQILMISLVYNIIAMIFAAIIFPLSGMTMMMGCFGVCMAFSSLFALAWSCLLLPKLRGIFKTSSTDETSIFNDEYDYHHSHRARSKNIYNLSNNNFPVDTRKYSFNLAIQFPCNGCINKFNQNSDTLIQTLQATLKAENVDITCDSVNSTVSFQVVLKFKAETNNPKLVLEKLKQQFSSYELIETELWAKDLSKSARQEQENSQATSVSSLVTTLLSRTDERSNDAAETLHTPVTPRAQAG